jgi:hypothetical protein
MIADSDRLSLAPGVAVRNGRLADAVRGESWPLNDSGAVVLSHEGRSLGEIAREVEEVFSLPPDTARGDVFRFVWALNGLALVNVERDGSRVRRLVGWVLLAMRLAPTGSAPGSIARRRAIDTGGCLRAFRSALAGSLTRVGAVAVLSTAAAAQVAILAGGSHLVGAIALGVGTGGGIGIHEAAHAAALRGVPSSLVIRGRRIYVLHAAIGARRRAMVAVAGPLAVALLGVALLGGGIVATSPTLAIVGCPLAGHALALTVVGGDGRAACGI